MKKHILVIFFSFWSAAVFANQPILLIDFLVGASTPASPDANGNHWNTVGRQGDVNDNGTDLRLTDGTVRSGLNVNLVEFGTPTSNGQWDSDREGQPDWVGSDSLNALDDRANLGERRKGTITVEGLPDLLPGQWLRIELVSAATGNFGTNAPGLWNLEAQNSTGGNRAGDLAGSIVPTNGLTGDPFDWTENPGTSEDERFGFALFPNIGADDSVAPTQGWLVWDNVQPDGGSFTIHASTHGSSGNQRAPANALAVYVIPEPGTLALLLMSGLIFIFARKNRR